MPVTATSGGASGDPGGAVGGAVGGVSRRERPAKPALSRAGIVAAGLAILQSRGFAAVTMRSVAAALDTGPASLYAYVANRDELLREMLNVVLSEVPVPSVDPLRWREQLKDLLRDSTRAMERHPGIARVAMGYIPTEEHAMVVADTMLALLAAGGVGPQASAWAVDLLSLFITATAYETSLYSGGGPPDLAMMHEVVATGTGQPCRDAGREVPHAQRDGGGHDLRQR